MTYVAMSIIKFGCGVMDSNQRSAAYETAGMTTSLTRNCLVKTLLEKVN